MTNKVDWQAQFDKLVEMARIIDYEMVLSDVDECHFSENKIFINRNRTLQNQVYAASHELGHVNIRKLYPSGEFVRRFPGSICANNTKSKKIATIEEEVLAWDEAKKILKSLDIPINETTFNRVKTICLGTYM